MLSIFRMSATRRLSAISGHVRTASTMKEAVVAKGPKVQIIDSPIPKPGPNQIVTKVVYSGSNPKDWCGKPTSLAINLPHLLTDAIGSARKRCQGSL